MKIKAILIICVLISPLITLCQTPTWKAYTSANTSTKLCSHDVRCINFDSAGNVWFGTAQGGISRFNGTEWTNYAVADGLQDPSVNCITTDGLGNAWIGTWWGLSKFDGTGFTIYNHLMYNYFWGDWVFSVIMDPAGNKWLATVAGLYKFDDTYFTPYNDPLTLTNDWISTMAADSNFNIWCGSELGEIAEFNGSDWTLLDTVHGMFGNTIESIAIDGKGTKWIGTAGGGLFSFDGNSYTRYTMDNGLPDSNVMSVVIDRQGNKWIATWGGGIAKFNDSAWTCYNSSNSGLKTDYVSVIAIDKSGKIWCGTYDGVSIFDGSAWTTIQSNGLQGGQVREVTVDPSGAKWIATTYGFSEYADSTWKNFTVDNGLIGPLNSGLAVAVDSTGLVWFATAYGVSMYDGISMTNYDHTNSGLDCDVVWTVEVDKNNDKWFGTLGGGVTKFDGTTWTTYRKSNCNIKGDSIISILFDDDGNSWFSTFGHGVSRFNGLLWKNFNTTNGLVNNDVYALAKDTAGNVWAGTGGGLSMYNGTAWTNYDTVGWITSLAVDKNGSKWIGTGNGLYKFDDVNWTRYSYGWGEHSGFYNISNGLGNMYINSVTVDKDQSIWISSVYGVSRLSFTDPVEFSVTPSSHDVGWESGTASYRVISNVSWTDTCTSGWSTLAPLPVGGNNTIVAKYTSTKDTTRIAKIFLNVDGQEPQYATLTQTVKIEIPAGVNPADGGTIDGTGIYNYGDTVELVATPNKGYSFVNWTLDHWEISKNPTYITTAFPEYEPVVANFIQGSGIPETENNSAVRIYPNPANQSFTVKTGISAGVISEVLIYDLSGSLIKTNICPDGAACRISVSELPAGCYYLKIIAGDEVFAQKLFIVR